MDSSKQTPQKSSPQAFFTLYIIIKLESRPRHICVLHITCPPEETMWSRFGSMPPGLTFLSFLSFRGPYRSGICYRLRLWAKTLLICFILYYAPRNNANGAASFVWIKEKKRTSIKSRRTEAKQVTEQELDLEILVYLHNAQHGIFDTQEFGSSKCWCKGGKVCEIHASVFDTLNHSLNCR